MGQLIEWYGGMSSSCELGSEFAGGRCKRHNLWAKVGWGYAPMNTYCLVVRVYGKEAVRLSDEAYRRNALRVPKSGTATSINKIVLKMALKYT